MTRSRSNGKSPCKEETSRKSPPIALGYQRTVPYARGSLGKVFNFNIGITFILVLYMLRRTISNNDNGNPLNADGRKSEGSVV